MLCDLCEDRQADVEIDEALLCSPCVRALDVTNEEFATGALGDVTLPGVVIPPLGAAQALGIPTPFELGKRIGTQIRPGAGSRIAIPVEDAIAPSDSPFDWGTAVKVAAVGAGALAVGAIGFALVRSVRRK